MNTAVSTAIPKPLASGVASTAAPRLAPPPAPAAKSLRPVLIDLQRLRRLPPTLALAWLVIATAALWALVPGWFAIRTPSSARPASNCWSPASRTGWARMRWGVISGPA